MEWVRTSHESLTGRDGYLDFYKKDVNFFMLGPVGDKIEQWTLKEAFHYKYFIQRFRLEIKRLTEITLTLSYDYNLRILIQFLVNS